MPVVPASRPRRGIVVGWDDPEGNPLLDGDELAVTSVGWRPGHGGLAHADDRSPLMAQGLPHPRSFSLTDRRALQAVGWPCG